MLDSEVFGSEYSSPFQNSKGMIDLKVNLSPFTYRSCWKKDRFDEMNQESERWWGWRCEGRV